MPSSSPKQRRFMAAVAHNAEFAAKVGVPQSVGEEFNAADERLGPLSQVMGMKKKRKRPTGLLSNGPT